MPSLIGKQAVVVGAGIGGLTAARAVADYFERVVVLERDALPERAVPRAGVPQGKHVHALLAGGQRALGADLIIGASGRGTRTLSLVKSLGWRLPEETTVGVEFAYATAIFAMPTTAPDDWKGVFFFPHVPKEHFGALLLPMEGQRWIV